MSTVHQLTSLRCQSLISPYLVINDSSYTPTIVHNTDEALDFSLLNRKGFVDATIQYKKDIVKPKKCFAFIIH